MVEGHGRVRREQKVRGRADHESDLPVRQTREAGDGRGLVGRGRGEQAEGLHAAAERRDVDARVERGLLRGVARTRGHTLRFMFRVELVRDVEGDERADLPRSFGQARLLVRVCVGNGSAAAPAEESDAAVAAARRVADGARDADGRRDVLDVRAYVPVLHEGEVGRVGRNLTPAKVYAPNVNPAAREVDAERMLARDRARERARHERLVEAPEV